MQRFKQPNMDLHPDGEWIRYEDHVEAMKRIAGNGAQAEYCWVCNGAGSVSTGVDEASTTICRTCEGTGYRAAPAPSASPAALKVPEGYRLVRADLRDEMIRMAASPAALTDEVFNAWSDTLQVENARDAARYRWLRDDTIVTPDDQRCINVVMGRLPFRDDQKDEDLFGSELDETIDAAMSASPPAAEE